MDQFSRLPLLHLVEYKSFWKRSSKIQRHRDSIVGHSIEYFGLFRRNTFAFFLEVFVCSLFDLNFDQTLSLTLKDIFLTYISLKIMLIYTGKSSDINESYDKHCWISMKITISATLVYTFAIGFIFHKETLRH